MLRFFAGFFVVLVAVFGAPQDPVQWKLTFDSKAAPPGSKILGHLTARIEPGWHLYSLTTPRPPIATTAVLAENPAVAGFKVYQPKPLVKPDPTFNVNTETFGEEVTFLYEIELKKDAPAGPGGIDRAGPIPVLQRQHVPAAEAQDRRGDHQHRSNGKS